MFEKLTLITVTLLYILLSNSFIHAHYEDFKPCPMCKLFNNDGLIEKSKEELIKLKENIENHLNKEKLNKIGDKAVEKIQDCLNKVNKKLEEIK